MTDQFDLEEQPEQQPKQQPKKSTKTKLNKLNVYLNNEDLAYVKMQMERRKISSISLYVRSKILDLDAKQAEYPLYNPNIGEIHKKKVVE